MPEPLTSCPPPACLFPSPLALLAACATQPKHNVTVEKQSECPVQLTNGQNLILTLPSNPTTGYRWSIQDWPVACCARSALRSIATRKMPASSVLPAFRPGDSRRSPPARDALRLTSQQPGHRKCCRWTLSTAPFRSTDRGLADSGADGRGDFSVWPERARLRAVPAGQAAAGAGPARLAARRTTRRVSALDQSGPDFLLVGDVLLAWPGDLFVFGLGAFLVAHLAYLKAYLRDCRRLALLPWFWPSGSARLLGILIAHDLGPVLVPVIVYGLAISAMLWRALARLGTDVPDARRCLRQPERWRSCFPTA